MMLSGWNDSVDNSLPVQMDQWQQRMMMTQREFYISSPFNRSHNVTPLTTQRHPPVDRVDPTNMFMNVDYIRNDVTDNVVEQ